MYFCLDISYVVRELEEKKKLRKFMRIKSVPSEDEVYSIISSFDPDQFINFVIGVLNNLNLTEEYISQCINGLQDSVFIIQFKVISFAL
jgi:hypothetical protein